MHYHDYILGYGGFGEGGIVMMILWIILIAVVVWLVVELSRRGHHGHYHGNYYDDRERSLRHSSGLDILNERYAKGEITKEEYEAKKKDILS